MKQALFENYDRADVTFVRGDGCSLFDDSGNEYLDFIAGIAVCSLGHAHPKIGAAVAAQASKLVHVSNLYHHEPAGTLARELVARGGLDRVFFCNSGTEANEAAIKLARKYAWRNGETQRSVILACNGSFHGRTYGALAATSNTAYKEGFGPMPNGFAFTAFNDIEALEANITQQTAAFIVEPVQGESGIHPATREFLARARERCDQQGALLIFDEIQCGMGRLGPLFAYQRYGVRPDVITMAKALANGLPIGAVLAAERVAGALQPGDHGSTFGGSPLPCAAAIAHLCVRDELKLEPQVYAREKRLRAHLKALAAAFPDAVAEVRSAGLLAGIQLYPGLSASEMVRALRGRGVLAGTAGGNTLRLAPPLIVSDRQIDRAFSTLYSVLESHATPRAQMPA